MPASPQRADDVSPTPSATIEPHALQNAQGLVFNNPLFNQTQISQAEKQAAAYDSSEHPRNCHPGTHPQYIDQIVNWGSEGPNLGHRIFWLKGPAGVGKSAIAQSDNSISYQWASKRKPYAEIVKSTVHDDPTFVDKELRHQFYHLFVSPLRELTTRGKDILERVAITDGLNECRLVSSRLLPTSLQHSPDTTPLHSSG
ncbi:hypothetical protein P691DRAFT_779545 [Macrolepiota fuliginosa MF-IS2]|uniref:Uncharacterized protein n=1 Tax=Macrolepiota fuliginosa MF-IS2 TaxID=1400762 RepID=A0A9P5X3D0_9AGAR|nr:hypothetical protein P691DRAFT_779545 [Macrolepiota fuliginosa MF-IS2]